MTTIVYKDGILATDSRLSANGALISDTNIKAIKTRKYIAAASGDGGMCDMFLEWARLDFNERAKPDVPYGIDIDDFEGMHWDKQGNLTIYNGTLLPTYVGKVDYYTSGSGGDVAKGALLMGASAIEAVEIAKKVDMNSGGAVQTVTFNKASSNVNLKVVPVVKKAAKKK